jgi:Ras-related protein Rab-32
VRAQIGVDFALKVLQWDADTVVRLQLWDIAGQERFGNMTRVRAAHAHTRAP